MITIATLLWDANDNSLPFSRVYDEAWVEKLYRGFARNLTVPFLFVCYVDRLRKFCEPIQQRNLGTSAPTYADCIKPYAMDVPMILVGLDTVITGNCDDLARHCLETDRIALPKAVYRDGVCNGVALVPAGHKHVYTRHNGENDMEWMEAQPHDVIDDLFPGQARSFKGHVKHHGIGDTRIVFFHGEEKPHQLPAGHPILEHWV